MKRYFQLDLRAYVVFGGRLLFFFVKNNSCNIWHCHYFYVQMPSHLVPPKMEGFCCKALHHRGHTYWKHFLCVVFLRYPLGRIRKGHSTYSENYKEKKFREINPDFAWRITPLMVTWKFYVRQKFFEMTTLHLQLFLEIYVSKNSNELVKKYCVKRRVINENHLWPNLQQSCSRIVQSCCAITALHIKIHSCEFS